MQQAKFPFTRGPNGFYQRMSEATVIAEEERKQQRRQDLEIARRTGSTTSLSSNATQKLVDSKQTSSSSMLSCNEENPVIIVEKSLSPDRDVAIAAATEEEEAGCESDSSPRMDPQKIGDLDIFEMEMETEGNLGPSSNNSLKTPKKGKVSKNNSWTKLDLQQLHRLDIKKETDSVEQQAGSSSSTKQWQVPTSAETT
jgi:hypothetical protein